MTAPAPGDAADRPLALATGATGFVGAAIVEQLLSAGYRVRAAARRPQMIKAGVEAVAIGDLAEPIDWGAALEGVDVVVHAAGLAHQPRGGDEALIRRVNVEATTQLAAAARSAGVARFLLISSVRAVAGAWSPDAITDQTPPEPTEIYGRSKLAAEQAALEAGAGVAILRPAAVCGAGAKGYFALLAKIAATPLPLPIGGLSGRRAFVTDRNLAHAALAAIRDPATVGRRFLVAEPAPLTIAEFVTMLRAARGAAPRIAPAPAALRAIAARAPGISSFVERLDRDLIVDCAALRSIGWTPIEASETGLRRMAGLA